MSFRETRRGTLQPRKVVDRRSKSINVKQVLLVTSSRMPERWIVPGGSVEPDEDSSMAAMREVEEEAGVRGKLDGIIGVFEVGVTLSRFTYPFLIYE